MRHFADMLIPALRHTVELLSTPGPVLDMTWGLRLIEVDGQYLLFDITSDWQCLLEARPGCSSCPCTKDLKQRYTGQDNNRFTSRSDEWFGIISRRPNAIRLSTFVELLASSSCCGLCVDGCVMKTASPNQYGSITWFPITPFFLNLHSFGGPHFPGRVHWR